MSVLSELKTQSNIIYLLGRFNNKICFLCYIVGLFWFLALPHHEMSSSTYFSENALLPGLVDSEFYHDFGADSYYNELTDIMKERHMYQIPSNWLLKKFRKLGLDTYTQNYTFKYPFGVYSDKTLTGQNVYAIMRAPRTSGTEALVLSVPFGPELDGHDATYPGIALMLALAKSFRRNSYWAKDIIFLVTDNKEIGIQAWLSSYHHIPNKYIKAEVLPGRSGSIQAALNLELTSKYVGRVNVKFEGVNGRLPNLDLFNTVERLFHKEGLRIIIQKKVLEYSSSEWQRYLHSTKQMLIMMWNQASGIPTGNHGYFHKFNIDAVTIQGFKSKSRKQLDFTDVGRAFEGIFRSLNNLLERFHQSFFFYLLPSPDRYISIGVYMPPLGIMLLPIVIKISLSVCLCVCVCMCACII
ncbi:hypothetical protein HELRODRAFT_64118 [Helobdella robusta]|uniref:GPI-anchor transamidase component GPAA1 n=1 Tax=Helobdella robusta TaxID=6412 RepID=T1FXP8_HELRO|nr:hypothetical protein HELRODRAFT_64118 [Helobdella robusta]ESO06706.1 hypothetical protein HELRODRAFT_64118 [Helobdella robusta]